MFIWCETPQCHNIIQSKYQRTVDILNTHYHKNEQDELETYTFKKKVLCHNYALRTQPGTNVISAKRKMAQQDLAGKQVGSKKIEVARIWKIVSSVFLVEYK